MNDFDLALQQVDSIQKLSALLLKTPHYKAMGESGILSILFASKAVGIDPFQGLNGGFYVVKGKVGMSTELMACLIRRAGHSIEQDPQSGDKFCTLTGKRKDTGNSWTITFSMDDAIRAGLAGSEPWRKYPSAMLYNRAMSFLARQLFADVIKGYGYTEDELKEIAESKTIDVKPLDSDVKPPEIDLVKPEQKEGVITNEATKESIEKLESLIIQYKPKIRDKFDALWAKNVEMNGYTTKRFVELQTEAVLRYIGDRDANH